MDAVARRTVRLAKHKATLAAHPDAARAFEACLFPVDLDQATARTQLLVLGTEVHASLLVLSAALLANVPIADVIDTAPREPQQSWGFDHLRPLLYALARKQPELADDDIAVLFELAPLTLWYAPEIDRAAVTVCEGLDRDTDAVRLSALLAHFEAAFARADDTTAEPTARALRPRLRALINMAAPTLTNAIDLSPISGGDGWSQHLATTLPELVTDTALATDALAHLSTATSGTSPTKKWRAAWGALVARGDDADTVARALVEALVDAEPIPCPPTYWGGSDTIQFSFRNADLARGAIWAVGTHTDDATAALLGRVAVASHLENNRHGLSPSSKVANAAVTTLGTMATPAAVAELARLHDTIKNQGVRKIVAKMLLEAARANGISTTRLTEGSIPDFGLDASGAKTLAIGTAVARVRIGTNAKALVEWFADAAGALDAGQKAARTPPSAVAEAHAEEIAALKTEVKELTKTLQSERARLETLIGGDESWPCADWADLYWQHPVTGHLGRRLAWRIDPGDAAAFVGFAFDDPTVWIDATGTTHTIDPDATTVRPWHPVRSTPAEIHGLRAVLAAREIRQPFKQAYREVYLLTPAERETGVYSNRFAAHVLRYPQAYALMKERGWATNFLGGWDGGDAGCAQRRFDDAGITAQFFHDAIDPDGDDRFASVALCSTDQVRFIRTGDRGANPLPLAELDPVLLSEALRDVDLFVGVCSIGNDPEWADRGEQRHAAYWQHFAFGELGSSAEVRRDALAQILPKLKIAAQCELDDRNLVVHGQLGTYRIHLGSGNVMMDPSRYLCIVTGRGGAKTGKVFLPFEDDHLLTVILSKAFLLAADTKITDPTILLQMGVPR